MILRPIFAIRGFTGIVLLSLVGLQLHAILSHVVAGPRRVATASYRISSPGYCPLASITAVKAALQARVAEEDPVLERTVPEVVVTWDVLYVGTSLRDANDGLFRRLADDISNLTLCQKSAATAAPIHATVLLDQIDSRFVPAVRPLDLAAMLLNIAAAYIVLRPIFRRDPAARGRASARVCK